MFYLFLTKRFRFSGLVSLLITNIIVLIVLSAINFLASTALEEITRVEDIRIGLRDNSTRFVIDVNK